jgi:large subunit ribosomal protein L24
MKNKLHIKKGDTVKVLSGESKGKSGKVLRAFPKLGLVLVEGINIVKRHQKPTRKDQKGQIIEKTMPIRASKVALADKKKPAAKKKAAK